MAQERGAMVDCFSCGRTTALILSADGTYRCQFCAKPLTRPEGLPVVEIDEAESTGESSPALWAVLVFVICLLFVPIILLIFIAPIVLLLCIGNAREKKDTEKRTTQEPGIV
jgi:hypothetical protein